MYPPPRPRALAPRLAGLAPLAATLGTAVSPTAAARLVPHGAKAGAQRCSRTVRNRAATPPALSPRGERPPAECAPPDPVGCRQPALTVAQAAPIPTRIAVNTCAHGYTDRNTERRDAHGPCPSRLRNTPRDCPSKASPISDDDGMPTPHGIGLRNHLEELV